MRPDWTHAPLTVSPRDVPGGGTAGALAGRRTPGSSACHPAGPPARSSPPGERARAPAGTGSVHRRGESRQLPGRRAPEPRGPAHARSASWSCRGSTGPRRSTPTSTTTWARSRSRWRAPDPGGHPAGRSRVLGGGRRGGHLPEGPFSRHGRLVRGQPGVALVALRSGVPVVPAAPSPVRSHALAARRFFVPRRVPLKHACASGRRSASPRCGSAHAGVRADVTGRIMERSPRSWRPARSPAPAGEAR